jgi:bifunctional non-homologous end joining protein LigD
MAEHLDVAGSDVLKAACNLKLEGIVSKRPSEPYVSGRTGIWTKAKCRNEQHAVVGGWMESNKGFAGLLVGVYRGKKLIPIVGTGFARKLVAWLVPRLKQLEIDKSSFAGEDPFKPGHHIHWVHSHLIAGIQHTSCTNERRRTTTGVVQGRTSGTRGRCGRTGSIWPVIDPVGRCGWPAFLAAMRIN